MNASPKWGPHPRWPDVLLPSEEFERWVRARDAEGLGPDRMGELYLAHGCALGDRRALAAFDAEFIQTLGPAVARFGDEAFVTEVAQRVRHRLLVAEGGAEPRISEYRGRGELAAFVRAVAVRTALNLLEAEGREAQPLGDDALLDLAAPTDNPELAAMKQRYREDFKQAFATAMAAVEPQVQTLLRLYYLDGLGLADLGRPYGWSVPTASRRLNDARAALLQATRQAMGERLGMTTVEVDSVLRLIQSQLAVDMLAGS